MGKFIAGFSVVVLVTLLMSLAVGVGLSSIIASTNETTAQFDIQSQNKIAFAQLLEQQSAVRGFIATGDKGFLKLRDDGRKKFDVALSSLKQMSAGDPDLSANVSALSDAVNTLVKQHDEQIGMRLDPAKLSAAQASISTMGRLTKTREIMAKIDAHTASVAAAVAARQSGAIRMAIFTLVFGGVVSVLAACAIGWLLTRSISAPIRQMTDAMNRLAAGDLSIAVPHTDRRDEIGAMAQSLRVFKDNAMEKQRLEQEASQHHERAQARLRDVEEAHRIATEDQANVVRQLASRLQDLADGKLDSRIDERFPDAYKALRMDFNQAVKGLGAALSQIGTSSQAVASAANAIASGAAELGRRAEHQAATLEQTAAAHDQITATVSQTLSAAREAAELATGVSRSAEDSRVIVGEAVAAISDIQNLTVEAERLVQLVSQFELEDEHSRSFAA
eukprot:gene17615-17818_t